MSGDYYSGPNPLLKGTLNSVERERLRERDREARAQMTHEAEQRGPQDVINSGPLFGEIVRVNPKSNDFERQQIERKLGKFEDVKHLLDQDVANLFGIDGQPPSSTAPAAATATAAANISKSSSSNSHEFKKPNMCSQSQQSRSSHHHHHHHSSSQRGGFLKPADGKPPYGGRGFYPGQPMKHSSSSSNDFRGSGMVPAKGPPVLGSSTASGSSGASNANHHSSSSTRSGTHEFPSTTGSKMHQAQRSLPKLLCEPLDTLSSITTITGGGSSSQANVENILDEMTSGVRTPLTAIAATPRKEMESKFTFNPVSGKMESLSPLKPPVLDKNSKSNALNSILGPPGSRIPLLSSSVFKPGNIGSSFTSPSNSSTSSSANCTSVLSKSSSKLSNSTSSNGVSDSANLATSGRVQNNEALGSQSVSIGVSPIPSAVTGLAKSTNVLPTLKSDLSLSEDSEDDDDDDDENNNDSEEDNKTTKSISNELGQKPEVADSNKLESTIKSAMSPEEVHDSSSSDDSESDSGSESEDSSSDSPSPPSLPLPVPPDPEDNKHRWNLKNFLPPQSAHGNSTPAPQTPQACENDAKLKTDSDSSGGRARNTQVACSSSSDSDGDSVKSRDKRKCSRTTNNAIQSDDSTDYDDRSRRKYRRRSSTSSQSSDDSSKPKKVVNSSTMGTGNTSNGSANSNSNLTVVGVVKPHQRKPPSPQVFNRSQQPNADERFPFVQRPTLQMTAVTEPQCELPVPPDGSDRVIGNLRENHLAETFQSQRAAGGGVRNIKSTDKPVAQAAKTSGKGRKPKSPALSSAGETPGKKKRGRKKTPKVPNLTDTEDDEPKVKVPEKRKPGRPPLRRNDSEDVDWNAGSRQKTLDKLLPRWGGRERRRTETRYSLTTDSDVEPLTATVKPTARVPPAIKKKEGAGSRDSSCESSKNDSDFTMPNATASRTSITKAEESPPKLDVEGVAVQDKKKNDTLRKLFSRREEGGGKGGGKGKGGKGKCGVIVMESETERKMLERSLSPAPTLRRMHDHMSEIAPPLQPQRHMMNDRVPPELSVNQMGNESRSSISRRQGGRVPEMDSAVPQTIMSSLSSIELPKLTYNENGKPSLMCKIDLVRIPYILAAKKRSEEMRTKSELSDTRQPIDVAAAPPPPPPPPPPAALDLVPEPKIESLSSDDSANETDRKRAARKHSKSKTKSNKRKHHIKEEPSSPVFATTVHTPSVDPESDSMSSDSEHRKKIICTNNQRVLRQTADPIHSLMNSCYPMNVDNMAQDPLCVEQEEDSWGSCSSSCSESVISCRPDKYTSHGKLSSTRLHIDRKRRKTRIEHSQRHSSLMESTSPLLHLPGTNHERIPPEPSLNGYINQRNVTDFVRPPVPTHHGIYYSYLERKVSEEMSLESDSLCPNAYLAEAKRLKHAADSERDPVAQGMQYLEAILSFVLTGHVLERRSSIETAFNMYIETLKLIVFISKKFRALCSNAAQSNISNKIAILSLRCESILNLKIYMMRELEAKNVHNTVTEYFNKPSEAYLVANQGIPSPHSPTPSPASSVGSNSSGYSSGDRRTGGVAKCVAVSEEFHEVLKKQHDFYSYLIASFNYWDAADKLIFSGGNRDFFIELDRFCGPLTLHSSLKDLVHYVRVGIQRLKAIVSHHHRV